jgi:predicted SprT family Zn-dependent metalloprotease
MQKSHNSPKSPKKITLKSRRGTKVNEKRCSECGVIEKVVWRYAQSNRGPVYICSRCKPKVFDRSFKRIDALDNAVSGGAFETNPRRH